MTLERMAREGLLRMQQSPLGLIFFTGRTYSAGVCRKLLKKDVSRCAYTGRMPNDMKAAVKYLCP